MTDPDETIEIQYTWLNGNTILSETSELNLSNHTLNPFTLLTCLVEVEDAQGEIDQSTAVSFILDRPPSLPVVEIGAASLEPNPDEPIFCVVDVPSEDPDGETVTYQYRWYKNGVLQASLISSTVDAENLTLGDVWLCVVTPETNSGIGPSGSASVSLDDPCISQLGQIAECPVNKCAELPSDLPSGNYFLGSDPSLSLIHI